MDREIFDTKYRPRLEKLSTCNLSDALDKLGLRGAVPGILPLFKTRKIVGRAVTLKTVVAGPIPAKHHIGSRVITAADPGDIIVVDNAGRMSSCFGGVLGEASKAKGLSGIVIDGAARDVEDNEAIDFPVYARGPVMMTARGRIMEEDFNCLVSFGGYQVRPGDIVMADPNGVVIVHQEHIDEVLKEAESLLEKEEAMIAEIRKGVSMADVDKKFRYEGMLDKK